MVFFKDYTCPSYKLKYLIIGTKGSTVETKILVQDSLVGCHVDPWPQLRNTLHMRSWTSEYNHKSNKASKVWYLEKPNPQGEIPTEINTSLSAQEMVFSKLGAKHQKYETYLTTFLSCWLCAFVFPSEEGNFIRPETFKMANLMESGRRIHYPLTSGPSLPRMMVYSGEGAAKFFDKVEARKRAHRGGSIVWNATTLSRPHPTYYIDDDIPGYLENDIRIDSLNEGLRYWRVFISRATMSKAIFPPAITSTKKLYTTQYSSWWERSNRMFLEDNLEVLVEKAGSILFTLLEDKSQDIEKTLSKVKTSLVPQHQKQEQKTSSTSHDQSLKGLTPNSNELSRVLPKGNGAMFVFEGKGVVFNHKKKYIFGLGEEICGKLSRIFLDNISYYKDDICEIFKEMSEMNLLYLSPLKSLVDSLFDHATSYDKEHSNFVDKMHEHKKMELLSNAKERHELFKVEEGEREGLKAILEAAKKNVEEIQARILATEDEISSYENMSSLIPEDSIHLEQKRECLEASH
ncbi:hypothetical protein H5410_051242 [Solanum commersonii]|uniref:Aminotransferase-like plant mobile domain-containing protein n=1 Tax=Solanum commersonii TaxID=4109 RepID=A0A9J5WZ07_SOLCO|nr:hypothetical protein H5410_051242 [Solanum commersonii]